MKEGYNNSGGLFDFLFLVVAFFFFCAPYSLILFVISYLYYGYSNIYLHVAFVGYLVFFYLDSSAIKGSGSKWNAFMSASFPMWSAILSYFPSTLHSQAALPSQPYLFCVHPNNLLSHLHVSALFLSEAGGWDTLFPLLSRRALTSTFNFRIPIWREILLWAGFIDSSRESASQALQNGHSLIMFPSLEEAFDAHTDGNDIKPKVVLHIHQKRGFVRFAIQHGVPIVPVFLFGISETVSPISFFGSLQNWFSQHLNVALPLFYGKFFTIPRRHPVNAVVGEPVKTRINRNPSEEDVDLIFDEYVAKLAELFDTYKANFGMENAVLYIA